MQSQYAEVVKRIKALSEEWEKLLDPRWMKVDHVYIESLNDEDPSTVADTDAVWQYGYATVRWYLPHAMTLSDSLLEDSVVHEYVHVLMAAIEHKIPKAYEDQREYTVQSLARALQNVRKAS